jgi:hypothetical protein
LIHVPGSTVLVLAAALVLDRCDCRVADCRVAGNRLVTSKLIGRTPGWSQCADR